MVTRRDAFTGLAALGAGALVQPSGAALRVGVVDLFRVLKEPKAIHTIDEQLKAWIDKEQAPLNAKHDELEDLEAKVELLAQNTPEALAARRELEHKRVEFKYAFNAADAERQTRIKAARKLGFEIAQKAIGDVAKSLGLHLVLQARGGDLDGETESAVSAEIYLRTVLYADGALDITSDVLSVLNR
jgi:Skp family chaperone for outer membrane proteins